MELILDLLKVSITMLSMYHVP